jgi:lysophospholipase L1-like esterase
VTRRLVLAIVLAFGATLAAQQKPAPAASGPKDLPDLKCPAKRAPPPQKPPVEVEEIPSEEELGELAKLIERAAPELDAATIAGFGLPENGNAATPKRIALWGDSHLAAGIITNELRRFIEYRGYTVGARHVPATIGRAGVRLPIRHACVGSSWTYDAAYRAQTPALHGPGLMNLRSTSANAGAYLWLDLRDASRQPVVQRATLLYQPAVAAAAVTISINEGPAQRFAMVRANPNEPGRIGRIELSAAGPLSIVKLKVVQGTITIHGLTIEGTTQPNVVLDTFGITSATARGWTQADAAYLKQYLGNERYDAVLLEYGTNEGNAGKFNPEGYADQLSAALTNMRTVMPDAACLLLGPTDRGVLVPRRRKGPVDLLKFAHVHEQISRIQAEVAPRFNCAAWDWQAFMGGPGGAYGWATASPTLMARDLIHLSATGYRRTAAALARSLGWTDQRRGLGNGRSVRSFFDR